PADQLIPGRRQSMERAPGMDEAGIRALLEQVASAEAPPSRVDVGLARIRGRNRLRRRWAAECAAAVVAVIAVAIPAGTGVLGQGPGQTAGHRSAAPVVYVAYPSPPGKVAGAIIPISTATNSAGRPIRVRFSGAMVITPDGKTLYVATGDT